MKMLQDKNNWCLEIIGKLKFLYLFKNKIHRSELHIDLKKGPED